MATTIRIKAVRSIVTGAGKSRDDGFATVVPAGMGGLLTGATLDGRLRVTWDAVLASEERGGPPGEAACVLEDWEDVVVADAVAVVDERH